MIDEFKGKLIREFAGLKSKMYYLIDVDNEENSALNLQWHLASAIVESLHSNLNSNYHSKILLMLFLILWSFMEWFSIHFVITFSFPL